MGNHIDIPLIMTSISFKASDSSVTWSANAAGDIYQRVGPEIPLVWLCSSWYDICLEKPTVVSFSAP